MSRRLAWIAPPAAVLRFITAIIFCAVISGCSSDTTDDPVVDAAGQAAASKAVQSTVAYEPPPTTGYVGSTACRQCHQQIADSYARHPMASSVRAVTPEIASKLPVSKVGSDQRFLSSFVSNSNLVHAESLTTEDGAFIWKQPFVMDFMVGSGQRAHAFLYHDHDMLFQSPLNWYATSGGWDLAPGFVQNDARRFRRRATDECLACHAGQVNAIGRNLNRFKTPVFHEASIGCENCHGPGQPHIAFHKIDSLANADEQQDPIVHPGKLQPVARDSICYQCHLQTTARVLRPGRTHFDFRPGMELNDVWTPVDVSDDDDKAVRHVQQMRASECYQNSDSRLSCITCHDPHRKPAADQRPAFYRDRCFRCHNTDSCSAPSARRRSANDSCIRCHMPAADAKNMAHVSQTDHRILKFAAPRMAQSSESAHSADVTVRYFDDIAQQLPEWEANRGLAIALWSHADVSGRPAPDILPSLLKPALQKAPTDHFAPTLLAAFFRQRGELQQAEHYYRLVEQLPAGEESAFEGLLVIYYLQQQWNTALSYADRILKLQPGEARLHALRADILLNVNRPEEAIQAARRSVELDPTVIPVREWLVKTLRAAGRNKAAIAQQKKIQQLRAAAAVTERPVRPNQSADHQKGSD